jgi:hypothetical protein
VKHNKNGIMKKEFCPACSNELSVDKIVDTHSATMKCKHCNKTFKLSYDEKTFPSNVNSFNWGAFVIPNWWGFWNGKIGIACLCWALSATFKLILPILIYIPISIYLGIRGNKISWVRKDWSSIESFESAQKKWNVAGIILLCVSIVLGLLVELLTM